VEILGALIFGSLFLYELVTGAANVPGFPDYHYAGILWIILYTKWPVVGIYLYHAALMCVLLTLALIDLDRQRCPLLVACILVIIFSALPVFLPSLQSFTIEVPFDMPEIAVRCLTCLAGAAVGWSVAVLICRKIKMAKRSRALPLAATLIGATLGWQATAIISLVFATSLLAISKGRLAKRQLRRVGPARLLFLVVFIHHPFWKWIAELW
jgi:leader peptidase (prepilin peptidase)/N-methyltransferase